ncbi:MAG: hypothetical protein NVSMB23_22370 [Myxococcales bacterium]
MRKRTLGAAAAGALLALAFAPGPAFARKRAVRPPLSAGRPEDDARFKGDARVFARAKVAFVEPSDEAELPLREEGVRVSFAAQGYALGPAAGALAGPVPHAHLIVDNEVALTVSDATRPVFIRGIKPGAHSLRLVLCRPWHEVVKAPGAFALTRFWVGPSLEGKKGRAAEHLAWPDPRKPLLTYVLPLSAPPAGGPELAPADPAGSEGAPAPDQADGRRVLDFYLSNAKLVRRGYRVRVVIDKKEYPTVRAWKPVRLDRLRPGTHHVTIDLLDRRGNKVRSLHARTDRTF